MEKRQQQSSGGSKRKSGDSVLDEILGPISPPKSTTKFVPAANAPPLTTKAGVGHARGGQKEQQKQQQVGGGKKPRMEVSTTGMTTPQQQQQPQQQSDGNQVAVVGQGNTGGILGGEKDMAIVRKQQQQRQQQVSVATIQPPSQRQIAVRQPGGGQQQQMMIGMNDLEDEDEDWLVSIPADVRGEIVERHQAVLAKMQPRHADRVPALYFSRRLGLEVTSPAYLALDWRQNMVMSKLVLLVAEVDPLRETQTRDGDTVLLTTVFLQAFPSPAQLVLHAWGNTGAEKLAKLESGDVAEFGSIQVHAQPTEENRRKGNFPFLLYFTSKKGCTVRLVGSTRAVVGGGGPRLVEMRMTPPPQLALEGSQRKAKAGDVQEEPGEQQLLEELGQSDDDDDNDIQDLTEAEEVAAANRLEAMNSAAGGSSSTQQVGR